MQDKIDKIVEALKAKACVKQGVFRSTQAVFNVMKEQARDIATLLDEKFDGIDNTVKIEYTDISEFEFSLKFSGDLLIFSMHTNVIAFPPEHVVNKSPYIQQDTDRGFFGQILIYNFMADSVKYNRLSDAGVLMGRMVLNKEGHFYIEGARQLSFLYPDVAQNLISPELVKIFIEDSMLLALATDLTATNFQEIQFISLGQKMANQGQAPAEKVGFSITASSS